MDSETFFNYDIYDSEKKQLSIQQLRPFKEKLAGKTLHVTLYQADESCKEEVTIHFSSNYCFEPPIIMWKTTRERRIDIFMGLYKEWSPLLGILVNLLNAIYDVLFFRREELLRQVND